MKKKYFVIRNSQGVLRKENHAFLVFESLVAAHDYIVEFCGGSPYLKVVELETL